MSMVQLALVPASGRDAPPAAAGHLSRDVRTDHALGPFDWTTYGGLCCTAANAVIEQKCFQYWDGQLIACNRRPGQRCRSCGSAYRKEMWVPALSRARPLVLLGARRRNNSDTHTRLACCRPSRGYYVPRTNANAAAAHRFSVFTVLQKHFRRISEGTEKQFWKQVDNPAWSVPAALKKNVPTYALMGGRATPRAVCHFLDPRRHGSVAQRDPQEGCTDWSYYEHARVLHPRDPYDLDVLRHRAVLAMVSSSPRRCSASAACCFAHGIAHASALAAG